MSPKDKKCKLIDWLKGCGRLMENIYTHACTYMCMYMHMHTHREFSVEDMHDSMNRVE